MDGKPCPLVVGAADETAADMVGQAVGVYGLSCIECNGLFSVSIVDIIVSCSELLWSAAI